MDVCDKASDYAALLNSNALANQLAKGRAFSGESLFECVDCGEEIPEGRRKAVPGCMRCVTCEASHERAKR